MNILSDQQSDLGRKFAALGADRFEGVSWQPGSTGAPIIENCLAWVECSLELAHDAGDHEIVLGRVLHLSTNSGAPLLYYRGEFRSLGAEAIGSSLRY